MKKLLTEKSQKLIEMLLMEPKIAEAVFMDVEHREAYKILDINEDGTLTLGKRSMRWWNRLFNLEKTISFKDFSFNAFRALVGMADNMNKNTILNGLSQELIAKSVLDQKYDFVIERLFDVARFATENGILNTVATPANGKEMPEHPREEDVHIVLQNKGFIPIYGCDGKILLNLRVKVDGYSFDRY